MSRIWFLRVAGGSVLVAARNGLRRGSALLFEGLGPTNRYVGFGWEGMVGWVWMGLGTGQSSIRDATTGLSCSTSVREGWIRRGRLCGNGAYYSTAC